jgi:hypothetical protein
MSTVILPDHTDEKAAPKSQHRDDYTHLETLDQLGLVRDKYDHLTPVDALFNAKESSAKPKREPRAVL